MKQITERIFERGAHGMLYVRRRIPAAIRAAYPPKKECLTRSLHATDLREAKRRANAELALLEAEFQEKRQKLDLSRSSLYAKRVRKLDDAQLESIAKHWAHQVLGNDEHRRQQGLDDDEFDALGTQLTQQRQELGRMLAQPPPRGPGRCRGRGFAPTLPTRGGPRAASPYGLPSCSAAPPRSRTVGGPGVGRCRGPPRRGFTPACRPASEPGLGPGVCPLL